MQSLSEVIDETFKGLALASLLYPLDRAQALRQLQTTFADPALANHTSLVALSFHHGLLASFRGYMPFLAKLTLLNLSAHSAVLFNKNPRSQEAESLLSFGFATLAYLLTYPLEIVNLRMSAEVSKQRFYLNTRQCLSKIRKNEGVKALYRGFSWAYSLFALQLGLLHQLQARHSALLAEMGPWERVGATVGAVGASEVLLYPLTTLKKIYQINGAMGHIDENWSIRVALRRSKLGSLWRGFDFRVGNILLYGILYGVVFEGRQEYD